MTIPRLNTAALIAVYLNRFSAYSSPVTPPVSPNSSIAGAISRRQLAKTTCNAGSLKSPNTFATGPAKSSRRSTMTPMTSAIRVNMALAMRPSSARRSVVV